MIRLENVSKIYKGDLYETKALEAVFLHVEQGEFVAIMGESGSGKTTLLNIIGGMDTLSSGEYFMQDIAVHKCRQYELDRMRRQYISFIFQHFALMEEYNVYENIEAPLLARNIKKKDRKRMIVEAADKLGISDILNKYPFQISGGQKQRAAFARALVADTPVILADEPTGALDENNTRKMMELLELLHEQGKTILLITHDLKVAMYADRIIEIQDGKIRELDDTDKTGT